MEKRNYATNREIEATAGTHGHFNKLRELEAK